MRGYFSFLLALIASIILAGLLSLHVATLMTDLSDAVAAERTYGLDMNVKEAVLESVRSGAHDGFAVYDSTHDLASCSSCPDHFCAAGACDGVLCLRCFRESGARLSAIEGAGERLDALRAHAFDPDFGVSFADAGLEAFLVPDPFSKNGFSLGSVRFRERFGFNVSSTRFSVRRESGIPGGFSVEGPSVG